jgi:hypothetical protein
VNEGIVFVSHRSPVEVRLRRYRDDLPKPDTEEGETGLLEGEAVLGPEDVWHAAEEEVQDPEDECGPQIEEEDHVLCAEQDYGEVSG